MSKLTWSHFVGVAVLGSSLTMGVQAAQMGGAHPVVAVAPAGRVDLFQAVRDGDLGTVVECLADGEDPNRRDPQHKTPLFRALMKSLDDPWTYTGIVQVLFIWGARVDKNIMAGLYLLAGRGYKDFVKAVLAHVDERSFLDYAEHLDRCLKSAQETVSDPDATDQERENCEEIVQMFEEALKKVRSLTPSSPAQWAEW